MRTVLLLFAACAAAPRDLYEATYDYDYAPSPPPPMKSLKALLKMHGTSHDMLRTLLLFHEAGGGPMGGGPGGAIPAAAVPRPGFSSPSRSILGLSLIHI